MALDEDDEYRDVRIERLTKCSQTMVDERKTEMLAGDQHKRAFTGIKEQ